MVETRKLFSRTKTGKESTRWKSNQQNCRCRRVSEGCSSGVGGMDVGTTRFLVGENVRTLTKHDTYVNWSKGDGVNTYVDGNQRCMSKGGVCI